MKLENHIVSHEQKNVSHFQKINSFRMIRTYINYKGTDIMEEEFGEIRAIYLFRTYNYREKIHNIEGFGFSS